MRELLRIKEGQCLYGAGGYPNQKFLLTFTIVLLRGVAGVHVVKDDRYVLQKRWSWVDAGRWTRAFPSEIRAVTFEMARTSVEDGKQMATHMDNP